MDVARQIRMSSKQYQDSLREAIRLQEEKINEALEKEEKRRGRKKFELENKTAKKQTNKQTF